MRDRFYRSDVSLKTLNSAEGDTFRLTDSFGGSHVLSAACIVQQKKIGLGGQRIELDGVGTAFRLQPTIVKAKNY